MTQHFLIRKKNSFNLIILNPLRAAEKAKLLHNAAYFVQSKKKRHLVLNVFNLKVIETFSYHKDTKLFQSL